MDGVMITFLGLVNMGRSPSYFIMYFRCFLFLVGGWSVLLRASGKILSGLNVQWRPVLNLGRTHGRAENCFFVVYMFRWKHGNFLKIPPPLQMKYWGGGYHRNFCEIFHLEHEISPPLHTFRQSPRIFH